MCMYISQYNNNAYVHTQSPRPASPTDRHSPRLKGAPKSEPVGRLEYFSTTPSLLRLDTAATSDTQSTRLTDVTNLSADWCTSST